VVGIVDHILRLCKNVKALNTKLAPVSLGCVAAHNITVVFKVFDPFDMEISPFRASQKCSK
jgi:hypothetical protein